MVMLERAVFKFDSSEKDQACRRKIQEDYTAGQRQAHFAAQAKSGLSLPNSLDRNTGRSYSMMSRTSSVLAEME